MMIVGRWAEYIFPYKRVRGFDWGKEAKTLTLTSRHNLGESLEFRQLALKII